ncbi:MAG: HAD family hydrolase [Actinomyces sp.]|nr:MAG: HAD family hydrolase [Actinomyces sp.]
MKRLLLDFGGVVLLTPFELRDRAEPSLGVAPGALSWAGPFDPAGDEAWRRFQSGEITERDYWAHRAAEHGLDTRAFMRHFYDPPGDHLVRPEVRRLMEAERAAGRPPAILTNDLQAFHGRGWMAAMEVLELVDVLVDGSVTGVLKPDPRAYAAAVEALGVAPADIVFVDDQAANVAGAAAAGLDAVWFDVTDPASSVAEVRRRLAAGSSRPGEAAS